jgi:hypothetical protein
MAAVDEPMSELQRSLMKRRETLHKTQPAVDKAGPSPGNKVGRVKSFNAKVSQGVNSGGGGGGGGGKPLSLVEEMQMKRNMLKQRSTTGGQGPPERAPRVSSKIGGSGEPGSKGVVKPKAVAPPPPAPKRNAPKIPPSDDLDGGVAVSNAANESTSRRNTRTKAEEIASRLGVPPAQSPKPMRSEPPAGSERPSNGVVPKPASSRAPPVPPAMQQSNDTERQEPTYVNLLEMREEMNASKAKEEDNQLETPGNKPHPGADLPPPAPRRDKSMRATRAAVPSSPGASGDGTVVHPKTTKRSPSGRQITPVNSSSESDYSGDGKVQRLGINGRAILKGGHPLT